MSCIENAKAYIASTAPTTPAALVILSTDGAYSMVTVINEGNQPVRVAYSTADGGGINFIVPTGFSHTRKMKSNLVYNSVTYGSSSGVAGTGTITFNFGN